MTTIDAVDRAAIAAEAPPRSVAPKRPRIQSLDLIRGAVMILMAIDHVRVYSGLPAGGPTPGIFFTRWITNFCAPAFVFLAGTGAFLYGDKAAQKVRLSRFLLTRGAWLVLLELTVLRLAWTFNFDYRHYLLAGVIWMLGWCFILMAGLVRLPLWAITVVGAAIVGLHDLLDPFLPRIVPALQASSGAWFWQILYFGGPISLGGKGGPLLAVLFSIVPWIGVMALGYSFGALFRLEPAARRRVCFRLGLGAIALFLVLRGFNLYGDPRPWTASKLPPLLAFLNTAKYPASLSFLLMTLGPAIALIPLLERARGWLSDAVALFGRVPLFYYLLHIPLIHALALVVTGLRDRGDLSWLFQNHPMMPPPPPQTMVWSLPLLYLVFAVAIGLLYLPCRWFAGLKARRRDPWLSYL